jgi:hypothetical protein
MSHVHIVIVVVAATFVELLVVLEEQAVDDCFDNGSTNDKLDRLRG